MCRTFDENDSRLLLADDTGVTGVTGVAGDDVADMLFVRVGDVFGVEIGIDELFRLDDALSEPSFRMLCIESGRYRVDGEAEFVAGLLLLLLL